MLGCENEDPLHRIWGITECYSTFLNWEISNLIIHNQDSGVAFGNISM